MDTWRSWGLTDKCVGFCEEGRVSEGEHCEHLSEGDQAYGHFSEHDKWGAEMHLMCDKCYEAHTKDLKPDLNEHHKRMEQQEADRQDIEDTREPLTRNSDYTSIRVMKDMHKPRIV